MRDFSHFVKHNAGTAGMDLALEGVSCAGCVAKIERGLFALPDVTKARVNLTERRLAVEWTDGAIDPAKIVDRIAELGYRAHPYEAASAEKSEIAETRFLLRCLGVAAFAAMNVMLLSVSVWSGNASDISPEQRDFFHWLSALIALPAAAYAGQPFFRSAWRALKARHTNMDVPISIGVILALALSVYETWHHAEHAYFDASVMLLTFLLAGRYLDHSMRRRTSAIATNLAALRADMATKVVGDELIESPVAAIVPGDLVLVRPGERIAVDGVVIGGTSEIDNSLVTGETAYLAARPGSAVFSGTLNVSGLLRIKATKPASGSLLDEIDKLLQKATAERTRYVRLADRAASLYAPVVHTTALLTLFGWLLLGAGVHDSIVTAISVLIITCPCALGLAIPAVQVVAVGALFRAGVLLNRGDALERLAEVDTIVFDKTGTLTLPEPEVANAATIDGQTLSLAGRLALGSRHPLAVALAKAVGAREPLPAVVEQAGRGVLSVVDGQPLRLGSPEFCDAQAQTAEVNAALSGCVGDRIFARQDPRGVRVPSAPARRRSGCHRWTETGRLSHRDPVRRPQGVGCRHRSRIVDRRLAGRLKPRGQDRAHRGDAKGRAARADGRRWSQRCAVAGSRQRLDVAGQRHASRAGRRRRDLPRRAARTGRHGVEAVAPRLQGHEAEFVARGDLQRRRAAGGDRRSRDATDRGRGDVGLFDPGDGERAAGARRRQAGLGGRRPMEVLIYLVPLALLLGLLGLAAFLWTLNSNQYDDLDGAAWRAISDDEIGPSRPAPSPEDTVRSAQ